jgi:hypothetical protein
MPLDPLLAGFAGRPPAAGVPSNGRDHTTRDPEKPDTSDDAAVCIAVCMLDEIPPLVEKFTEFTGTTNMRPLSRCPWTIVVVENLTNAPAAAA